VNSRSNLAYDHYVANPYPVQHPQTQSNVRIRVSKTKQQVAQRQAKLLSMAKILLVASLAFLVLYRGVIITDTCNAVEQKQNTLNALITSNEKLQVEIDRSLDLDNIETIARDQLGMRRAEKYQTIYIDLEQVDYVEKTAKSEFSPTSHVSEFFSGLMAYLD